MFVQEAEMNSRQQTAAALSRFESEVKLFKKDNLELRQYILALQSEVYGARLAAKYLDKELAGREIVLFFISKNIKKDINVWKGANMTKSAVY